MNPKTKKKKGIRIVVQNVNGISNTTKSDIVEKALIESEADVILQLDTRLHTNIQARRTKVGKWNPKFAGNKNIAKRGIQLNVNPS